MKYLKELRIENEILSEEVFKILIYFNFSQNCELAFKDALVHKYDLIEKYKIFLDEENLSKIDNSESNNFNEFSEFPKKHEHESNSSINKNDKGTKLTIKLKPKYQNENNFFYSILKANGQEVTKEDYTHNYTKSDMESMVSEKKLEIASKNIFNKIRKS